MTESTKRLLKRKLKKKVAQPGDVAYPELENALAQMDRLIDEGLENKKKFLQLEAWALNFMADKNIDTYTHGPLVGTPVRPEGEDVDWEGIKKALTAQQWESILGEPQPVKAKLEALIELKQVKPEVIEPHVRAKPIKPHIRITRRAS